MNFRRCGFSLLELSIVLVILGLLVGGILAGQSLIRASETRSIVTDYQRYTTALNAFRDKYMALPGDIKNATQFWGRQTATADCITTGPTVASASGACDGNGDGRVFYTGATYAVSTAQEPYQIWRHLALAGLVEGNYTGVSGSSGYTEDLYGTNVPRARISNGAWASIDWDNRPGGNSVAYAMYFARGFYLRSSNSSVWQILKPAELWNIDTKLDDGRPARGTVIALGYNNACAVADDGTSEETDFNASYRLSDNSLQCAAYFINLY